ncbi:MAG: hypothetical protein IKO53_04575 [Lachnospiraceae bacterium]|nr:hypothetical protein [Lachnospiraceae bacterium]
MSDMYNEDSGKIRCEFRCEYPYIQEFAGHIFRHLAGGLYKAEEEFDLTAKEARQILHEYRQVRLLVRKNVKQRGVYSDYCSWRPNSEYCTLEVGKYPVYHVLYAYAMGYEDPNLNDYLNYQSSRVYANSDPHVCSDLKKIKECYRRYDMLDTLCSYVFSELGYYKGKNCLSCEKLLNGSGRKKVYRVLFIVKCVEIKNSTNPKKQSSIKK